MEEKCSQLCRAAFIPLPCILTFLPPSNHRFHQRPPPTEQADHQHPRHRKEDPRQRNRAIVRRRQQPHQHHADNKADRLAAQLLAERPHRAFRDFLFQVRHFQNQLVYLRNSHALKKGFSNRYSPAYSNINSSATSRRIALVTLPTFLMP